MATTFRYGDGTKYGGGLYGPGTALDRWQLQLELAGAGGGWTDVSDDVRAQEPLVAEYGIDGNDPTDRVGDTGTLSCALDNSEGNSGGVLGYYAPFHANKRLGFGYDIGVRWILRYKGTDYYKFRGSLADIDVQPGRYGARLTRIQAVDYMDDLARIAVPDVAAQTNKRGDELITMLLAAVTTPPAAQDLETGQDTFAWALDGGTGQGNAMREELQKICLSEQGYVYIKGDTAQGGTLAFEARGHRSLAQTTYLTFDNDMVGCTVAGSRDDVYGLVRVIVHPTRVDSAATTVLFSLENTSTLVAGGATIDTLFGPYRDPSTQDACGGTAMVAPVATTDYTMNSAQDVSGTDLTASFSVSASYTGQGVRYTITNSGGTAGYITKLQARGKGVYRSTTVVEQEVVGCGDRVLELDLPYQTSVNAATNIAVQMATALSTPRARVQSVTFCASASEAFLGAALQREPGDRIAITEAVTGLDAALFTINSVRLELRTSDLLWCTWGLVPWGIDPWWTSPAFAATGGTITDIDGFRVHTFTSNGTFTVTSAGDPVTVEVLLVAGGGAGGDGNADAAGGGAGGQVVATYSSVSLGAYSVAVGAGGSPVAGLAGGAGGASTFNGLSAAGGSGGGTGDSAEDAGAGTIGGGGGAFSNYGTGTLYRGGSGGSNGGGGGAGASGNGADSPGFNTGGDAGPGVLSSITGASVGYGGGGSGAGSYVAGSVLPGGVDYGGGVGGVGVSGGTAGAANRGAGGGGCRFAGGGGAGSAGVVIIRYPISA